MAVIKMCHPHRPVSESVQDIWSWVHGRPALVKVLTGWDVFLSLLVIPCNSLLWRNRTWPLDTHSGHPKLVFLSIYLILFCFLQASQLGVYRAFVDNYEVAMETAEKCCQANAQFAEISEVMSRYSDTWAIWIWLIPCNVTYLFSNNLCSPDFWRSYELP